jgi:hypothetical protein
MAASYARSIRSMRPSLLAFSASYMSSIASLASAAIADWAKGQDEKLSISPAICRLVERALAAAEPPAKPPRSRPGNGASKRED